jgi:hypothetical protein
MARTIATVTLSARIRQETSPVRATMDLQATAMAPKVAQVRTLLLSNNTNNSTRH